MHNIENLSAPERVEPPPKLSWIWRITNFVPIVLIRLYKAVLSPYFGGSCRFQPTCSSYGLEAFQTHNFFAAFWLTLWRIVRCNPFTKGGYDPVPKPPRHQHRDH